MSLLGAICNIMAGSGLQEVLECVVYANNTVGHMLSGKAISRALRGHILVSGALNVMLTSVVFGTPLPDTQQVIEQKEDATTAPDHQSNQSDLPEPDENPGTRPTDNTSQTQLAPDILTGADKLYDDLMAGTLSLATLQDAYIVEAIAQQPVHGKNARRDKRTAKLWLQYLEMVEILLSFINSDRTANLQLHLKMGKVMLHFLAAAGHDNYANALHLYLQNIHNLHETHLEVYMHFEEVHHVISRGDRYWAGLSSDLIIELFLMRSLKTIGGLIRRS